MTINGRLLNWGVFFVTTGALVLAITAGLVTADGLAQLFRLWPVLVIALGVGVLLRATRLRAVGGIVLAVVPALVLGGLLGAASLAEWDGFRNIRLDCRDRGPTTTEARLGTFTGAATVDLDLAWGELVVTTRPGSDWHFEAAARPGSSPDVEATAGRLAVTSADRGWGRSDCREDTWRLELPTAGRLDLAAEIAAGTGTLDLAGATLGDVDVILRAGEARFDLGKATAEEISLRVEAGSASLVLPATGEVAVDVNVNGGAVQVCAPEGMGLRVRSQSALASIATQGLVRVGDAWESLDYATSIHHADVTVAVNVGSVDVNPVGGCK